MFNFKITESVLVNIGSKQEVKFFLNLVNKWAITHVYLS
jgi:hypothetical protein